MTWVRERAGVDVVRKRSAARAVLKALGDGQLVGVPFDTECQARRGGLRPVLRRASGALTSRTLARLVRKSHAIVVPVFIVREPDNRHHRIVIQDHIALQESADAEADIEENTRASCARSKTWCGAIPGSSCGSIGATARGRAGWRRYTRKPGAIAIPVRKRRNSRRRVICSARNIAPTAAVVLLK